MRDIIIKVLQSLICLLPMRNFILFESYPDCSDNTKAVFDEMIRQGVNKDFKLIWMLNEENPDTDKYKKFDNVIYIYRNTKKANYYKWFSKAMISCNIMLPKKRKNQFYFYLTHGEAFKKSVKGYKIREDCNDCKVLSLSDYLGNATAKDLIVDKNNFVSLGFPRNDILLSNKDISDCFAPNRYSRIIYWLPTFRKHKNVDFSSTSISIPIIYNKENARLINEEAKKNNILIVIKPHFAQDLSNIDIVNLSNILFIDDTFFEKHNMTHYEFLSGVDALLTDYSSVYYDFMLCNKPIGLCWEDVEEFRKNNGFSDIDIDMISSGGKKIYTADDLIIFVKEVFENKDTLYDERNKVCDFVFKYRDADSSKRVVDFIMENIKK